MHEIQAFPNEAIKKHDKFAHQNETNFVYKDGQISQVAEKDKASEAAEEAGGGGDCQKCQQVSLVVVVVEVEQEVEERETTNGGGGQEEERHETALQVREVPVVAYPP